MQCFKKDVGTKLLSHYSFKELTALVKQYILHFQHRPQSAPVTKKEMQNILMKHQNNFLQNLSSKMSTADKEKSNKTLALPEAIRNETDHLDMFVQLCLELEKTGKTILPSQTKQKKELSRITLDDLEIMTLAILESDFKREKSSFWENIMDFWFSGRIPGHKSNTNKNSQSIKSKQSGIYCGRSSTEYLLFSRSGCFLFFGKKKKESKQNPQSQMKYLKTNYRSCPELIAFFNDFFPKDSFETMESINKNCVKEKEVARFIFIPTQGKTEYPLKEETSNKRAFIKEQTEFQETAGCIEELFRKGVKPEEIAVLSRQNKSLQDLAQYLKHKETGSLKKIPLHLHSSGSFKNRREVIDALFLLGFLLNPP